MSGWECSGCGKWVYPGSDLDNHVCDRGNEIEDLSDRLNDIEERLSKIEAFLNID